MTGQTVRRPTRLRATDPDATVSLQPRRPPPGRSALRAIIAVLAALAIMAVLAAMLLRRPAALPRADEPALLAASPAALMAWRFASDPAIIVAIFPSLHAQALALDRAALFVERAGAPHDRVETDAEARATIAAAHDTYDDLYEGHDYRTADLARFFATARRDGMSLSEPEQTLRTLLQRAGALAPGANQALITLAAPGAGVLDAAGRATILRHELSHGLYFTDPAYAVYVAHWWQDILTVPQRDAIRAMLAGQGYDTANEDLMRNEGQAYLIHTADPRFFTPASVGMDQPGWRQLRAAFVARMPPGWLRDRTTQ